MQAKAGAAPAASATLPPFALPGDYCSPGLPHLAGAAQQSESEKESTPRLFLGSKRMGAGAAAKPPPCATAASAAPPPALSASAKPSSLRGHPKVPRLNLAAAGVHLAAGAAASFSLPPVPAAAGPSRKPPGTLFFGKRRAASSAESSGSTGSGGGCAEDEGQAVESAPPAAAAAAAAEPASIQPAPGFSPPRAMLDCQLFEHSAAKPAARAAAASRRSCLSSSAAGTSSGYGASGVAWSSGEAGSEWGRPASYDPIAEELERWQEVASANESACDAALLTLARPGASAAALPSPASDSDASSGGAHCAARMPAPTAEAALEHLRQGLRALEAGGGASGLDAAATAELATLLERLKSAAGLGVAPSPASPALAALVPTSAANARPAPAIRPPAAQPEDARQENRRLTSSGSAAGAPGCSVFLRPAYLAALKAELLADLRASLLAELRGSAH